MKQKIFLLLSLVISVIFFLYVFYKNNNRSAHNIRNTHIKIEDQVYNFGTIKTGADGEVNFTILNTGEHPLIIYVVTTTCGCTIAEWTRIPVNMGKSGYIRINYDTSILGYFKKDIAVYANVEKSPINLTIQGRVVQ